MRNGTSDHGPRRGGATRGRGLLRTLTFLGYAAIPAAYLVHSWAAGREWEPAVTFLLAGVGIIPLAALMGQSTEHLAARVGPTWGGLLNATFGNAAELIIAIIALTKGLNEVVMASLTGSILGNLLLVAGGAMVVGGLGRQRQTFNRSTTEINGGLLALSVASVLFPTVFHFTYRFYAPGESARDHGVSLGVSVILLLVYGLGLLFTLKTHACIFSSRPPCESPGGDGPGLAGGQEGGGRDGGQGPIAWSVRKSVLWLLVASVGVGIISERLVGSAEAMAHSLGWNRIFVGVILLAIIGNAAEHSTALVLARRNDMDTAMTITYQSSTQIALFVTPVVVLLSTAFVAGGMKSARHLDLIFSPMEVIAVLLTVGIVVLLGLNGETNWFEGVLLLGLYAILAITFFYIPSGGKGALESGSRPAGPAAPAPPAVLGPPPAGG